MKHLDPPPALAYLGAALDDLRSGGLLRVRPPPRSSEAVSFCSNDYLGLAREPAATGPSGAGASRLVAGEHDAHVALEAALADWLEVPGALAFSSGYAANVGTLGALAEAGDIIVSDALNHASLIDGARLSRARVIVVPHLDAEATARALEAPRAGRAWVVTESYFSMDADTPDLRRLRELCDTAGAALVIDEAHALGVMGPDGRGLAAESGVDADVLIGTLGKAFGAGGAFVAGCADLMQWLWNRARTFVFSTGLSPALAAASSAALARIRGEPALRARVLATAAQFRAGLGELGVKALGFGHVIPWVVGHPDRAVHVAESLRKRGVHVHAIRPPSVPAGTARIRFTVTSRHTEREVEHVLAAVKEVLACERR